MSVLSRGIRGILARPDILRTARCMVPASLHTSSPHRGSSAIGDFIHNLRMTHFNRLTVLNDFQYRLAQSKWAKLFAIEGNIKSGKGAFAEEFAEKLGLRLQPSPPWDYFIRANRMMPDALKDLILDPESPHMKGWNVSLDRFYTNPEEWTNVGRYQIAMVRSRYIQYARALSHLLITGQGSVLERSFHSTPVFHSAIKQMKWVNEDVLLHFNVLWRVCHHATMPPQVVIYLDVPPELCLERIKASGSPAEKHITLDYLVAIDEAYKKEYLPEARSLGSKVIHLDWTKPESIDEIIIQLDDLPSLDGEFSRWDQKNSRLRLILQENIDDHAIYNRIEEFVPIEEMWDPKWMCLDMPDFPTTYMEGYVPGKDKFIWLKE